MGTCDALLDIVYAGQAALDRDSELALIQVDFSAAFDHVNRSGLLVKLQAAGVGGQDLSVIRCFLSERAQSAKVDGKRSRLPSTLCNLLCATEECIWSSSLFVIHR